MDGFTVDLTALQAVSTRLHTAATDLHSVITAWAGAAADGGSQFGTTECATAFTTLFQDLNTRLTTHKTNLDGLTAAAADTARDYLALDGSIAGAFDKVVNQ